MMASTGVRDLFGRLLQDLRVSVTDRCNFRCTYCMPKELFGERYEFLPRDEILSFEEIERLCRIFAGLGVTKLRLTGGEPLLRADLPVLVRKLAGIEAVEDISLTTNGYLLPQQAQALSDAGLHRVTISLDSLNDEVFGKMNGRGFRVDRVLEAIGAAEEAGLAPVKINSVVQRGVNDGVMVEMAEHFRASGNILRFIEYMDVGTLNGWRLDDVVPSRELANAINAQRPIEPVGRSTASETAQRYRYRDGGGEIGFISSVTEPFCGDCTRARLSTDGKLFTCLFASEGRDLRGPMRDGATDEELEAVITKVWEERDDRYSEERTGETTALREQTGPKVEMFRIGG